MTGPAFPRKFALPPFPPSDWRAVIMQEHDIAGRRMWAITIQGRTGGAPSRDWFTDIDQAYAWGLGQADKRHLAFIDLTPGGGAD